MLRSAQHDDRRFSRWTRWALVPAALVAIAWFPLALSAQSLRIERIVELPSGSTGEAAPIVPDAPWYDAVLQAEGAARLRILSPDEHVAGAFQFDPDPAAPGTLTLRVVLYTRPDPLEYRLLGQSRVLREGKLVPAKEHFPVRGLDTELAGEPGRVTRIIVRDDYGSELRWRQVDDWLVLNVIPADYGGKPVGAAEPFWAKRRLRFLDYRFLAGGFNDWNALAEWEPLDILTTRFNGFFGSRDTLMLERVLLHNQVWRRETWSVWLEGGAAFVQELDSANAITDSELTWALGGSGHWRSGDWGAALHLAMVNGPLVTELYGGWQFSRLWGLFLAYHQFDTKSAYALGGTANY